MPRKIECIVKLSERCNINCSYCYVFNGADRSSAGRPPLIRLDTIRALATFLRKAAVDLDVSQVQIDFHGGEPLMLPKWRFNAYCESLLSELAPVCSTKLCLQTNATLIDADWIDLFEKWKIFCSTSIDGPEKIHNSGRVDFRGRGTYLETIQGLARLQEAARCSRIPFPSAICVIDPRQDAHAVYRHLVNDLGITLVDFLLPNLTWDTADHATTAEYGEFLCRLFDVWTATDVKVTVRTLKSISSLLLGGESLVAGTGRPNGHTLIFTVASDGSLAPDDFLRACGSHMAMSDYNVFDNTLRQFLDSSMMTQIEAAAELPTDCYGCCWRQICGGGTLSHRYSLAHGFNNRSVFCGALQTTYAWIAKFLVEGGVPMTQLAAALELTT